MWSPITYDGQNLYAGTGNTCVNPVATANSIVKLSPSGSLIWNLSTVNPPAAVNPLSDDDFGGGETLDGSTLYATNKNGLIYALDASSGRIEWTHQLGVIDGYGGIGTPVVAANTIIASAGFRSDPAVSSTPGGLLVGMDRQGNALWQIQTQQAIPGYVAVAGGVAYASLDNQVVALDPSSGSALWRFTAADNFYASPAVVPSGIYDVDKSGNVYAFGLAAPSGSAKSRSASTR